MDLAKTQALLARIYTDADLRRRFLHDPQTEGERHGLTLAETQQLAKLAPSEVHFFADSLVRKRLNEAGKLLPLTRQALGRHFDAYFHRYAKSHALQMTKPHQQDAIVFAAFLNGERGEGLEPEWAADLARYEASRLATADLGRRWALCLFRCPAPRPAHGGAQVEGAPRPRLQPLLAVWFRLRPRGRLRHFLFRLPEFALRIWSAVR
jgi:hypothetical protein